MEFKAKDIAEILKGRVDGDPEVKVSTFARIESGKDGAISFFANPKYENYVYTSKASIIIVNESFEPKENVAATMIRVENSYSAIATLLDYITAKKKSYKRYRAWTSVVKLSSKIGKKVYVGASAYVGKKAVIGDYTKIYEQVYIGEGASIGKYCIIYPGVKIYPRTVIGDNVIIHANSVIGSDGFGFAPLEDGSYKKIEHVGNVIIEDDVEIGACTTIDKSQMGSTILRKGVKIDNLCQIAHNVEVGKNTVFAAGVGIAGSTVIGENCMFGGQSGVGGHLNVANKTVVGGQAGVISSVKQEGQTLVGMPAIPHMEYMRAYALFRRSGKNK